MLTTALFCVGADGLPLANGVPSSPPPSGSPSPTVNPNPSGNSGSPIPSVGPSVLPVPSPPKRPHEAPPVKMTTPPFSPLAARPSTVPPDMLWLSQADVITVPLQTFSQRPFVQAVLNGHPALFLLDTSTSQTGVDAASSAVGRNGLEQSLQLGELRFLRIRALRNGVRAYTQTFLGVAADGVIGSDLLARFPVALNYASGTFSVFRTSAAAVAARPRQAMVIPLMQSGGLPVVAVSMNGEPAGLFGIDTGAGVDFEVRSSVIASKNMSMSGALAELREARVTGIMHGKTARARSAAIGEMQIAGPLLAVPDDRQRWLPGGVDGMLGGRLLEKMNVIIDIPGQSLAIVSPLAATPSTYDRSGAWLVSRSDALYVHNILPGSPSDIAGLSIGDQILKVNNVTVSDLETVRQALMQRAGTRVAITYRRARRTHSTTLVLRNLL